MRITLEVGGPAETDDLRQWLRRNPELRGAVGQALSGPPMPGSMSGGAAELIPVLLTPGGLTAAVAAAVVAWLQSRRGNQTVMINRPDGTQVTVTSERVRGLTAEGAGDLAQRVAEALQQPPQPAPPTDGRDDRQPDTAERN
ncbi:effector-associated constant component EACC1 [Streptomyces sp. NPDC002540]